MNKTMQPSFLSQGVVKVEFESEQNLIPMQIEQNTCIAENSTAISQLAVEIVIGNAMS